jgi:hypothetical protein
MTATALRSVCLLSLFFVVLLHQSPTTAATKTNETAKNQPVQVVMKNVTYHFTDQIAVHIVQLQGYLTPTIPGTLIVFDDRNSFTLNLASAEIAISCHSLAQVLNENVFAAASAPIKDVTIESKNNQLIVKGKLHQKGDVSFESVGTLSLDADGRVRLHVDHLKAAHLPVKGLMDLLGLDVAHMINLKKIPGITAEKDDLLLDPAQILPPPRVQGKLSAIRIQGNELVQVFGSLQASNFAARQPGNYMAYHDGVLGFGKLIVNDVDLILVDMDGGDPFDFYLDHYQEQLSAGYIKITPDFGLRVYTRDYGKLRKRPAAARDTK